MTVPQRGFQQGNGDVFQVSGLLHQHQCPANWHSSVFKVQRCQSAPGPLWTHRLVCVEAELTGRAIQEIPYLAASRF